jgi:hypothetical protein
MGAVAVDTLGAVAWIDRDGRLRRHGANGVVARGVAAVTASASGLATLDDGGGLRWLDGDAIAALEPARDLALDETAGVAYLATPGEIVVRGLATGARRELAAIDAAALALSSDRRRLYAADRGGHRVLAIAIETGAPRIDVVVDLAEAEAAAGAIGDGPTGLALSAAGLVATWARAVVGINVRHGVRAVLHPPTAVLALTAARGVAAGRDKRRLWVVDGDRLVAVATDGTGATVAGATSA